MGMSTCVKAPGQTEEWGQEERSPCWPRTWWRAIIWISAEESAVCCRGQRLGFKKLFTPEVYESTIKKLVHHHQSRGPKRLDKNSIPGFPHHPHHQSHHGRRAWPYAAMSLMRRNKISRREQGWVTQTSWIDFVIPFPSYTVIHWIFLILISYKMV